MFLTIQTRDMVIWVRLWLVVCGIQRELKARWIWEPTMVYLPQHSHPVVEWPHSNLGKTVTTSIVRFLPTVPLHLWFRGNPQGCHLAATDDAAFLRNQHKEIISLTKLVYVMEYFFSPIICCRRVLVRSKTGRNMSFLNVPHLYLLLLFPLSHHHVSLQLLSGSSGFSKITRSQTACNHLTAR